jgi:hypothetical protein
MMTHCSGTAHIADNGLSCDHISSCDTLAFRTASAPHAARRLRGCLFCGLLYRCRIVEQNPFDYRNWQAAILDQVIMELTKPVSAYCERGPGIAECQRESGYQRLASRLDTSIGD